MQISAAQNKAAGELVDLVAAKLGSGRAVHSETAIASIARLAPDSAALAAAPIIGGYFIKRLGYRAR